jgi:hypothetical protein
MIARSRWRGGRANAKPASENFNKDEGMTKRHKGAPSSWRVALRALAAVAALAAAQAGAQTAVLVEAGNERLRDDLQWLADRGVIQLSTSTWPLPVAAIESALAARRPGASAALAPNLSAADRDALQSVERELARHRTPLAAGVALRANTASIPPIGFERPVRAEAEASAWLQGSRGPLAGRLQVQGLSNPLTSRQSRANFEGSYIAGQWWGQVLYAGQLAHWWGPGQDGSLIWSNAALAMPGVGLRRAQEQAFETRWLSWLGPWTYDMFLGRMLHNRFATGTRVFSLRLNVQPLPGFELGASRLIQWGGSVGDNGLDSLFDAFVGRSNDVNGAVNNEIAGFDARYTMLLGGNPLTLYGQFIGEDEADLRPTGFMSQLGVQFKHTLAGARMQWHLEAADTMSRRLFGLRDGTPRIAYAHSQFLDGMYHEGLPIAHFMGGDGRANSIRLSVAPMQHPLQLRYGFRFVHARVNPSTQAINLAFPRSDRVQLAEVTASWRMRAFGARALNVHAGVSTLGSRTSSRDTGVKLSLELPL